MIPSNNVFRVSDCFSCARNDKPFELCHKYEHCDRFVNVFHIHVISYVWIETLTLDTERDDYAPVEEAR